MRDTVKPTDELIAFVNFAGADDVARKLSVSVEFVRSWLPRQRELEDGRTIIEPGWQPSTGFIAAALAILRNDRS